MRTSGTRPLSYGMAPKLYSLRQSGYTQRPAIAPPFAFASVLRPSHSASGCALSWRFALLPSSSAPPRPPSPHPQAYQLCPGIGAFCFAPAYPLRGVSFARASCQPLGLTLTHSLHRHRRRVRASASADYSLHASPPSRPAFGSRAGAPFVLVPRPLFAPFPPSPTRNPANLLTL